MVGVFVGVASGVGVGGSSGPVGVGMAGVAVGSVAVGMAVAVAAGLWPAAPHAVTAASAVAMPTTNTRPRGSTSGERLLMRMDTAGVTCPAGSCATLFWYHSGIIARWR